MGPFGPILLLSLKRCAVETFARNPKARFDYHLEETFEAGMVLLGTQVKAIRDGSVRLMNAYVDVQGNEVWIKQLWIGQPKNQSHFVHDEHQWVKLLLTRAQIQSLRKSIDRQGSTVVPLRIYKNEAGKIKIEVAVATGKNNVDKKRVIQERDAKRQLDRIRKGARD